MGKNTTGPTDSPPRPWYYALRASELGRILMVGTAPASLVGRKRAFLPGEADDIRRRYDELSSRIYKKAFYR